MADDVTLKEAIERSGPFAVWSLMDEDGQRAAAVALWENSDGPSRAAIEVTLAKDLKFRAQSVRKLSADKVVGRLLRLADEVPEDVLFQFLFHLHMAERRDLLREFLDAVGLPHDDGALDLPEDFDEPDAAAVAAAAKDLVAKHDRKALVYLATLKVADKELWKGLDPILESYTEDGSSISA